MRRVLSVSLGIIPILLFGMVGCGDDDSGNNNTAQEICANGLDDDGDGLIDCFDPNCYTNPVCANNTETLCADGVDNDSDGYTDCLDSDCLNDPACQNVETNCSDNVDNDNDGDTDCDDSDCANAAACQPVETQCDDGFDNDQDGDTDCADSDCASQSYCETTESTCDDEFDNDGDGDIDCADSDCASDNICETTESTCDDEFDNDGDGAVDCADSDCSSETYCETTETICDDDFDNDGDGDIDCDDSDCTDDASCIGPETNCNNGQDDDQDGAVDCADSDCASQAYCETTESTCDDLFDNDGDGDVDCADSDCSGDTICESPETTCDDQFDNDGDGDIDCLDSDCSSDSACQSETNCNDGIDNDGDNDVDCADSDCSGETYCETTETTCNDAFDNDGDGDVDCADSDCNSYAACSTGTVGDPCTQASDCSGISANAGCLVEYGLGFPSGYCAEACDTSSPSCTEADTTCATLVSGYDFCFQNCTLANPTECRAGYSCVDDGDSDGEGVCIPECTADNQCTETNQCDTQYGFCVWGDVVVDGEAVTNDNNSNGMADPGETFDLAFDALNDGEGIANGPISVTVTVNSTNTTVTGSVNVTPPSNTTCSTGDLAAGASATCNPWSIHIPAGANAGERLDFDVHFTGANDSWDDTISLIIGSSYMSLLTPLDPQGDNNSAPCDIKDYQYYEDSGTLYMRWVFYSACTIDAGTYFDLILGDETNDIILGLYNTGSAMAEYAYDVNNSTQITPTPTSFQATPMSGSTDHLDFQVDISDIPVLDTTNSYLYSYLAYAGPSTSYDDFAPDTTYAVMTW